MSGVPYGLPHGWQSTTLQEIAEIVGGVTKDAKKASGPGFREIPYLRVANVQRGRLDLTEMKLISASESDILKLKLIPGDILLNEGGDRDKLGRGWIWQGQLPVCIHQNHVFRARLVSRDIDPVYIAHFTNSMAQSYFVKHGSQTTNLASISLTKLGSLPIQLPPIDEQARIVAKLEELLSDLDAGVAELKAAQKKLKRYRQSLLKAAVEGTLTASWRDAQRKLGVATETGTQLLEHILTERRVREPMRLTTTNLPLLPEGWVWTRVDQAGDVQLGRQRAPQFHTGANMVPYLRVANVFEDRIDISDVMEMHFSADDEATFKLNHNDVLLNEGQSLELVGRPAIYRNELPRACFTNTLVRFRAQAAVVPEFALIVFRHYMHSGRFKTIAKITTNIAHLGAGRFAGLEFPLPSRAEQVEIVQRFSALSTQIAVQEAAIVLGLKQSTAQRQNILRAAFAGQLVPQDPNDEPASVLLDRIRAERAARDAGKKGRARPVKESA